MFQGILEVDSHSRLVHHETADGFAIQEYVDLTREVERAKREAIEGRKNLGMGWEKAAIIPQALLASWAQSKGTTFAKAMRDEKLLALFLAEHPVFDLTRGRPQKYFNGT